MRKIYAKIYYKDGKPVPETLEEHTENLLIELEKLKNIYGRDIVINEDFWENLKFACLFHDLGKVSDNFQSKLKRIVGEKIPRGVDKEIPHNFLSGIFLYSKSIRKLIPREFFDYIFYAVVFHHDREINFDSNYLKEVVEKDISKKADLLNWLEKYSIVIDRVDPDRSGILFKKIKEFKYSEHEKTKEVKRSKYFILLKGLLHRLDHSASAKVNVEEERIKNPREKLIQKLSKKENFTGLKPFQEKAKDYENENILLTASTGMGKTEFAINWIGESKAFYTLPVRLSVNAMYDRFVNYFGKDKIGLLHSDAVFYGFDKYEKFEDNLSIEEHIIRTQATRQFAMPITITTADQLFTATFKYPGYEKVYATLAYSKIVLDEPQSYSPDTLAIIIKGLQEISELGGKFCFMSATIHPFIRERLKDYCRILDAVFNTEKKHKITLLDNSLEETTEKIKDLYKKGKKVLVILNTVKKSQEIYKLLKDDKTNVKLLHSLFINRDRKEKEDQIKENFKTEQPVIWITTQLVEASLDIDYDVLFTEIATLDALIQRMGRVNRRKGRTIDENSSPNIFIALNNPSDQGKIYNKNIVELTKEALKNYEGEILTEEIKQSLMEEVYNEEKIKSTKFYEKFEKNLELLEYGYQADTKGEAQKLFREVLNINVIPEKILNENYTQIDNLINQILDKSIPYPERLKSIHKLNSFTLGLPIFRIKDQIPTDITPPKMRNKIFSVNFDYNSELGLIIESQQLGEIL